MLLSFIIQTFGCYVMINSRKTEVLRAWTLKNIGIVVKITFKKQDGHMKDVRRLFSI